MLLFILYDLPLHNKFKNYSSERFRKAQLPRSFLIVMIFSLKLSAQNSALFKSYFIPKTLNYPSKFHLIFFIFFNCFHTAPFCPNPYRFCFVKISP